MKQTAVEFLLDELPKLAALSDFLEKEDFIKARTMIFEKAIKMEKEQIIESFSHGVINHHDAFQNENKFENAEQYYNETFKSE